MTGFFDRIKQLPPEEKIIVRETAGQDRVNIFFPASLSIDHGIVERLLGIIQGDLKKKDIPVQSIPMHVPSARSGLSFDLAIKGHATADTIKELLDTSKESTQYFMELRSENPSRDRNNDLSIIEKMEKNQKNIAAEKMTRANRYKARFFGYDSQTVNGLLRVIGKEMELYDIKISSAVVAETVGSGRLSSYMLTGVQMAGKHEVRNGAEYADCSKEMGEVLQKICSRFSAQENTADWKVLRDMEKKSNRSLKERNEIELAIGQRLKELKPENKFWGDEDRKVAIAHLTQGAIKALNSSRLPKTVINRGLEAGKGIRGVLINTYALPEEKAILIGQGLISALSKTLTKYSSESKNR